MIRFPNLLLSNSSASIRICRGYHAYSRLLKVRTDGSNNEINLVSLLYLFLGSYCKSRLTLAYKNGRIVKLASMLIVDLWSVQGLSTSII